MVCRWLNGRGQWHLLATIEKELVRVNAVDDGTSEEGEPVENHRGLSGVPEQELIEDVEQDGENEDGGETGGDNDSGGPARQ